jgi:hypothetical protein
MLQTFCYECSVALRKTGKMRRVDAIQRCCARCGRVMGIFTRLQFAFESEVEVQLLLGKLSAKEKVGLVEPAVGGGSECRARKTKEVTAAVVAVCDVVLVVLELRSGRKG